MSHHPHPASQQRAGLATSGQQCEAASSDRSKFFSGQKKKKIKIKALPARHQLLMWRSGALLAAK
jgi:hypothetical protein